VVNPSAGRAACSRLGGGASTVAAPAAVGFRIRMTTGREGYYDGVVGWVGWFRRVRRKRSYTYIIFLSQNIHNSYHIIVM